MFAVVVYWLVFVALLASVFVSCVLRDARRLEERAEKPSLVLAYGYDAATPPVISHRTFAVDGVRVDFSVIIPCYNEATRILRTLQNLTAFFEELTQQSAKKLEYEVIVVDDGSGDATIEVVQNFVQFSLLDKRIFRIFKLAHNCGKGVAVTEGMLRSSGAVCLFMDADDATEITEFRMLHAQLMQLLNLGKREKMESESYRRLAEKLGAVVGSRAHLQSKAAAERSHYRNVLMHGFHFLVWLVTFTSIKDTQCGFKLFTHSAVHRIFPHVKIRRWCFDVEVLFLAKQNGIPVGEVPVKWTEVPGSKVRFYHIAHMAWELAVIFFGYKCLSKWKTWKTSKTVKTT